MAKKLINLVCIMLIASFSAPPVMAGSPAPQSQAGVELAPHAPGEVLVKFQPWVKSAQAEEHLAALDLKIKRQVPALGVKLVKLPPGQSVEEALALISKRPGVEYVEPNYILKITARQESVDDQWSLTKIQAPAAWATFSEAEKLPIVLAVVDTGVDRAHTDLDANIWSNPGEIPDNGLDDDGNGFIDDSWGWDFVNNDNDPIDDNLHGTAVSSVMAGELDEAGVTGVCPWCKVMAVKVMTDQGIGYLDVVANGITYAANWGAQVINLSLAGTAGAQVLEDAVNYAWNQGVLVVAGAGNDGANAPMYPAGYANSMAVAATGENDTHACFSNYAQDYISVAAPGENIKVALPGDTYGGGSGTSLSSPMVVGLAGLLLSQDEERTNSDLRAIIESTAVDLHPSGVDAAFGHGRIDALRAVTGDTSQETPPDGLFSTNNTASGYAHARKLVRDTYNTLHMIWHTQDNNQYRIRYATSDNDGLSWVLQPDVYSSSLETYHSALAADGNNLYVAIPRRSAAEGPYQIMFTWKPISGGAWSSAIPLTDGTYDAVRPDLYLDPTNGRLHLLASSLDNAPLLYYRASSDQGTSWTSVVQVSPSAGTASAGANTRYATLHAYGDNLYIATKTMSQMWFFTNFYLHTVRSTDGGQSWFDQTQIASFQAMTSGDYGLALAGEGDRLYMVYELFTNIYFRRFDNGSWSNYLELETGSGDDLYRWPTIAQAPDGTAWMMFEANGQLYLREYDGSTWAPKQPQGNASYANLKLGTSGNRVEWIATQCGGAPFTLVYDSLQLGANNPPAADDQAVNTNEDTPLPITLTATDPDNDPMTYTITGGPSNGGLSGTPPNVTYQPDANYHGGDSFTFVANDGTSNSNTATVSIDVDPVNDPPTANDDSVVVIEDTPQAITLSGGDVDGDPITYAIASGPQHGTLSGPAPDVTYTPDADYSGPDSFTFTTSDGTLVSAPATISIQVNPTNDPPSANNQSLSTDEDVDLAIVLTATDPEGDPLTYTVTVQPNNGTLTGVAPALTYEPDADFNGSDSFSFVANDGTSDSNTATVSITVDPVNDAPTAYDDSVAVIEDTPQVITLTGADVDGDPITYAIDTNPLQGTLSGTPPNVTYTPDSDYSGPDSFTFTTSDGTLVSAPGTITIQVNPVNDSPTAFDQSLSTAEDVNLPVTLTASDPEGNPLTYTVTVPPSNGTLSGSAPALIYEPDANFNGSDSFSFVANDGSADSNTAAITVDVIPVNDKPTANNDSVTTLEDTLVSIILSGADVDGDGLSYEVDTQPNHGTLSGSAPNLQYTPGADYFGEDSFTFHSSDGSLDSDPGTITIQVNAVNDPPVADDQSVSASEDQALTITLTGSDPDDVSLNYSIDTSPGSGSLTGTAPFLTYTPDPDFNGDDSFTFLVSDGELSSSPGTVTITVIAVNDTPIAGSVSDSTQQDTPDTWFPVVSDVDGDTLNCSILVGPGGGASASVDSDCSSGLYTPPAGYSGTDSFSYEVCDSLNCADAIVSYTITAISSSLHIGDLDGGSSPAPRNRWDAAIIVSVHDAFENPVANAFVEGSWSDGVTGGGSCTTDGTGECSFTKTNIKSNVASAIFTITDITHAALTYNPADNHDPDPDSEGTFITVFRDGPAVNQPPQASFTHGCTGLTCDFDAAGSSDSDGSITSYDWDFGDGKIGSGATASNTYAVEDTFTVTLTVTDNEGAVDSTSQQVTLGSGPDQLLHVADLLGYYSIPRKNRWDAEVRITIHDAEELLFEGATVTGLWSTGREMSCTTNSIGTCTVTLANLKTAVESVNFTVTNVAAPGWSYDAAANHVTDVNVPGPLVP